MKPLRSKPLRGVENAGWFWNGWKTQQNELKIKAMKLFGIKLKWVSEICTRMLICQRREINAINGCVQETIDEKV